MAIKIKFDVSGMPELPTMILARRDDTKLGMLTPFNVNLKGCMNAADEFQFKIYKELDGVRCDLWDDIVNFKLIWCKEWNSWFSIVVELDETNPKNVVKNVSCTSLGEAELSQLMLYGIEVNTEEDIARDDYKPTTLYNGEDHDASLLHRIMDKAPHYTLKHVDSTLADIQRTFSFDDTSIYDAFQEISEEVGCIVVIDCASDADGKLQRMVSVFDLETNCNACNHRGEYSYVCPECGSKDLNHGYGEDTTIFISSDALGEDINFSTDTDSVKNCFKLEAGDDLMTASIINCNPNGSGYLWHISDEMRQDMSEELKLKLKEYDALYAYYQKEYSPTISSSVLTSYNGLIDKYKPYNEDLEKIALPIKGYPEIMNSVYNTIDFVLYLESGLMPTYIMQDTTAAQEITKLTSSNLSPVAISNINYVSTSTANSAVLSMAKVLVDPRYKVEIESSNVTDNIWSGTFSVTNLSDDEDTATGSSINVQLNDELETFVKQKIEKTLSKSDSTNAGIVGLFRREYYDFCNEIKKYCLNSLIEFYDACQSCINILIEQGVQNGETWSGGDKNLYDDLYLPYYNKLTALEAEVQVRSDEIGLITGSYDSDGNLSTHGLQDVLYGIRDNVQTSLNFEKYLGEKLWHDFCSYRREDKYSNDNYISDGLNNAEIFQNALEFIKVASKEIYKSAELQHSISTTLKNLLILKEFEPIVEHFEVGNWLRIQVDDCVYRLRLLEYEIDYDDLNNISVDFSDVTKNGMSDIKSVINEAKSMTTSYDAVVRQSNMGADSKNILDNWVKKGLDATTTRIVNNSNNQDQVFDKHGMLFRKYDDILDDYSPVQLKIINSTLAITDDKWKTTKTAIGNFLYRDPANNNQLTSAYGINAEVLVGQLIIGESLGIYNSGGSLKFDKNGFIVKNDTNMVTINPNTSSIFSIQKISKNISGAETYKNTFYVDDNGNLHMSGIISWDDTNNPQLQIDEVVGLQSNLNSLSSSISSFRYQVEGMLGTSISSTAIISPRIGGGYLYISNGTTSVSIDPKGLNNNLIFDISKYGSSIMGVDSSGNGHFRGEITAYSGTISSFEIGNYWLVGKYGEDSIEISSYGSITCNNAGMGETDITGGVVKIDSYANIAGFTYWKDGINTLNANKNFTIDMNSTKYLNVGGNLKLGGDIYNYSGDKVLSLYGGPKCYFDGAFAFGTYVASSGNTVFRAAPINNVTTSGGTEVRVGTTGILYEYSGSSRRFKDHITNRINSDLDPYKLYNLEVVQFVYKNGYLDVSDTRCGKEIIGLISEDVEEVYPIAVNYDDAGKIMGWNTEIILPGMLALLQDQHKEMSTHESQIKTLENRLESIEYKLQQSFEMIAEQKNIITQLAV